MTLTSLEIETEMKFRYSERIAIMCLDGIITREAQAEGTKDAAEWMTCYRRENPTAEQEELL